MRVIRLLLLILVTTAVGASCAVGWLCPFRKLSDWWLCKLRVKWARSVLWVFRVRVSAEHVGEGRTGPALCVANHTGYLDIAVLMSLEPVVFVSRREILWWPVIGQAIAAGGTLFVDRKNRMSMGRFVRKVNRALQTGISVAFFPEATSSDGRGILPFKSSIFAGCGGEDGESFPVRPFVLHYRTLGGVPVDDSNRGRIFWYGDMALVPHIWRLLKGAGIEVTVRELPARKIECRRSEFALALHDEMQREFLAS